MSLIELQELSKSFDGTRVVDELSLEVASGEVFGLLGPNGAGKTTTMMMLSGLLKPDSGTILLGGEPFTGRDQKRRELLGLVPQELAVYPDLTGRENLDFFARLYALSSSERRSRIDEALERVGLSKQAKKTVRTYSGGMKRRLNFAIALLHRPRLLILDEPTVGVDPQSRSHLLDCVSSLRTEGIGVIYASHYMEEVQAICDRVGIMDHGKMLACDPLPTLLERLPTRLELTIPAPDSSAQKLLKDSDLGDVTLSIEGTTAKLIARRHRGAEDDPVASTLRMLLDRLTRLELPVLSVRTFEPSLEMLFLELTGRGLRDS